MEPPDKRPSKYWCSVPHCLSDNRNLSRLDRFPYMKNVTFHPYPGKSKHNVERQKWLQLIRRPSDYDPKRHHRVCSLHFIEGKPTKQNPFPTLFLWNEFGGSISQYGQRKRSTESIEKRSSMSIVQDSFTCMETSSDDEVSFAFDAPGCNLLVKETITVVTTENWADDDKEAEHTVDFHVSKDHTYSYMETDEVILTQEMSTQTILTLQDIADLEITKQKYDNKDELIREFTIEKVTSSDESVKMYT